MEGEPVTLGVADEKSLVMAWTPTADPSLVVSYYMLAVSDRRLARHLGEGDDSAFSTRPTLIYRFSQG